MNNRIALFNFVPSYCPNCGERIYPPYRNAFNRLEYLANVTHHCLKCDTQYQLTDTAHLLAAATASGGDLSQYIQE